jgi:chromosome condensin MukBEF ATPase and DNA-binding subunit MukB
MSEKKRISASIDENLKEQLDNKDSINKSGLIETLLREYLAHGEGTVVALKVRREELRKEKQNAELRKQTIENEITSYEAQIEELTEKIKERRRDGLRGVDELAQKVKDGEMSKDYIHDQNPLIREKASEAGVPPRRFAEKVMEAVNNE